MGLRISTKEILLNQAFRKKRKKKERKKEKTGFLKL
jgi:hypothetical protein